MSNRSAYETQAIITLFVDARDRLGLEDATKKGLFSLLNDLIVESVTNGLWKYNTPTLMNATEFLSQIITNEPKPDVPLMAAMPDLIPALNDLTDPDQINDLLSDAIAKIQLEKVS